MLRTLKNVAKWLLNNFPGGNYIVFESRPILSDNTWAVFQEMQRRGLQKKYRMYWQVADKSAELPRFPNTAYLDRNNFWNRIQFEWITLRAKCMICCNDFLCVRLSTRRSFYLTHGTALKKLNNDYLPEGISYTLIASEHVKESMAKELRADPDTLVALGYPRNDALTQSPRNMHELFPGDFQKVVVWYPTFRQHKNGLKTASANALPVLHDSQSAITLNEAARECGILLVVKPHFMQDLSYIKQYDLSNIVFIDDQFFVEHNISSYEFVGSCDGLITDYSSIFFDYLLCDRPVAVIWEDIEDYRKKPGFAMDPKESMRGSHKIYTLNDFLAFLQVVSAGEDPLRDERQKQCALMNYASDGKNSQRVTDFIIAEANL